MGLFGASARLRDKSLASPEQYQPMFTPTVPESRPMDENITFPSDLGAAMNVPQIRQGGGAFGRGGVGWSILGAIGDSLSQMGGYGAPFAHQQALLRKQRMDEEQYQRRQDAELAQRKAMYDYELAHPKQPQDDAFARTLAAAGIQPGTPEYVRMNRERAAALTTRIVMTPNGPMMIGGGYDGAPAQDDGVDELPPGFTVMPGGAGSPAPRPFPER